MNPWRSLKRWTSRLREEDLDRELQAHLDLEAAEGEQRGLPASDARFAARRTLGNAGLVREDVRAVWRWLWLEQLRQDVRYGLRTLRHSPAFTGVAVLSLALGIGANAAVFALLNAVLLRVLPVAHPQELVALKAAGKSGIISYPMYRDLRERQRVFTDILATAGDTPYRVTIPGSGGRQTELDNVRVDFVSGNYFDVLGVAPAAGRLFQPDDDRNPNSGETTGSVVVLSDAFWERQFGRDQNVLGATILIGRSPCRVIGIAPSGFGGETVTRFVSAWVPLVPFSSPDDLDNRYGMITSEIARLKPGVTAEKAQASMTVLYRQLLAAESGPAKAAGNHALALEGAATGLDFGLRRKFGGPLRIVMAVVAVVLLIACLNIANLLLARAASRRGQIAVRLAIGCSRRRLIRQLLSESLLISLLGALAGAGLAWWGSKALARMISIRADEALDARVVLLLAVLGVLTGIAFGLAPALRATHVDLASSMKAATRGASAGIAKQRITRVLLVAQVALSLLLLSAAGLLIHSIRNLHHIDWGFRPEHVVIFDLAHDPRERDPASLGQAARRVLERIRRIPGIESASLSGLLLFSTSDISAPLRIPGYTPAADEHVLARYISASPGYFETLGMRLAAGRTFSDRDSADAPRVAVINQAMARRYFAGANPVGRTMNITAGPPAGRRPIEIVGVIRDSKYNNLRDDAKPLFYLPIEQYPRAMRSLEIRTTQPLGGLSGVVRQALAETNKDIMVRRVTSLSDQVDQTLAGEEIIMQLSAAFGALALLLACVGLHGVMSYAMTQRTSEIGIRMALGATRQDVIWLMLRETLAVVAAGLAIGIPAAMAASRLLSGFLYGLGVDDPLAWAAAIGLLAAASALAGLLPARRAARVDPMTALRYE